MCFTTELGGLWNLIGKYFPSNSITALEVFANLLTAPKNQNHKKIVLMFSLLIFDFYF